MSQPDPLDVLVVEDDPALRDVLVLHLNADGCAARAVDDGERALAACRERLPDVLVLDVMLPGRNGLEICEEVRRTYDPSPGVVLVTARGDEAQVIDGFGAGADDYVIKPCRPREIVARVRALARRLGRAAAAPRDAAPNARGEVLGAGPLRVELGTRRTYVGAEGVTLTATEFSLLAFLMRTPGRVYTRMQLLERVWDSTAEGYARNVDCHVTRIRRKLEAAGLDPVPLRTVHGVGYCFRYEGGDGERGT